MGHDGDISSIRLRGVVKRYGSIAAVDHLDLEVPDGTCVGLLGPNGAGKSTTMKLLIGQAIADKGEIEVLGYRLPLQSRPARASCGVVPQVDNLDAGLTVQQNLNIAAYLYRLRRGDRREAVERALRISGLTDRRRARVQQLSGGMRRRLLVARALVHRPRVLLLDEPTVGLDPQVRYDVWALLEELRSEGVSILMSTHYIEEAERLADTVTIMAKGRAVASGSPSRLVAEYVGREAVEIHGSRSRLMKLRATATAAGWRTRFAGNSITVLGTESVNELAVDGAHRPANLEDAFVLLTGEETP